MKKILAFCLILFIANCISAFAQNAQTPICRVSIPDVNFPTVQSGDTASNEITVTYKDAYYVGVSRVDNSDSAFSFKLIDSYHLNNGGYTQGYNKYVVYFHPPSSGPYLGRIVFVSACSGMNGGVDSVSILSGNTVISNVEDEISFKEISITPNPASDFVKVKSPSKNLLKAVLYNVAGEEVLKINDELLQNNALTFSVADFPSGVYYLKLTAKDNSTVRKIIINH